MAKKKNKHVLLPWCWYCEREFEDEKVLMQHQKAKHFKCNHCPRRLNTAGGLAVHIQQVHKLDPDKIENALPGRDGYDVEIFGMEGIPAPDLAEYKRRKEQELGLAPGTISQPPAKRARVENRVLSEAELKAQLEAHRALMGANDAAAPTATPASNTTVYNAAPQTYGAPPVTTPGPIPPPGMLPPGMVPPMIPGIPPPGMHIPPPFIPGMPFPPVPPGYPPFPGFMPPPPGMLPPGVVPPIPFSGGPPPGSAPAFVPASVPSMPAALPLPPPVGPSPTQQGSRTHYAPDSTFRNPDLKPGTVLIWSDANLSPEEKRSLHPKYAPRSDIPTPKSGPAAIPEGALPEESKGRKRARAEDFL